MLQVRGAFGLRETVADPERRNSAAKRRGWCRDSEGAGSVTRDTGTRVRTERALGHSASADAERPGTRAKVVAVDISDMKISANPNHVLTSYSLGSCLGVAIYDPKVMVGGILHAMLPLAKVDAKKAKVKPFMFMDTGLPMFLEELFKKGVKKSRAIVKLAGGSRILDHRDHFRIGERNYAVCRKILWKNSMLVAEEDVGGAATRTIRLEIGTGRFFVKSGGTAREL